MLAPTFQARTMTWHLFGPNWRVGPDPADVPRPLFLNTLPAGVVLKVISYAVPGPSVPASAPPIPSIPSLVRTLAPPHWELNRLVVPITSMSCGEWRRRIDKRERRLAWS